jgi:hypothetical protein
MMASEHVLKCPLCGGSTQIERSELLEALDIPHLREQLEKYATELLRSSTAELAPKQTSSEVDEKNPRWNPCVPVWRGNAKH